MESNHLKRHLAAVLYADVAGYSRLTGDDEEGTHRRLGAGLDVLTGAVQRHGGRVVHFAGDAVLAEFSSAVHALTCAVEAQASLGHGNRDLPRERRLEFRIGLNLGDVIADREDIYGEGVNIAARLEALADPGGICVSEAFRDAVGNKLSCRYEFLGERRVKNIAAPVRAYRVLAAGESAGRRALPRVPARRRQAVRVLAVVLVVAAAAGGWPYLQRLLRAGSARAPELPAGVTRQLSTLPSIAVLPLRNLSADPTQVYFSDGLTQDISTELSRFPELLVVAGTSAAAYRDDAGNSARIGRELGVRYLLEGSAERDARTLRLSVQLVDASTGVQLWADRFHGELADLSQTRDDVVQHVAATLAVRIQREEQRRVRNKPIGDLEAYDHVLRGREQLARGTRDGNAGAKKLLHRAIEIDPGAAAAYLALGEAHRQALRYGWAESPQGALDEMEALARRVLRLDDANAGGHQLLGFVYAANDRLSLAENEYLRAIELNPNDAESHAGYGLTLLYQGGRTRQAAAALETARRLDPHLSPTDGVRSRAWVLALAYYLEGRYGDAIGILEQHLEWFPDHAGMHTLLAAAYARSGREADAHRAVQEVRRLDPFFDPQRFGTGLVSTADRKHLYQGLLEAGLR